MNYDYLDLEVITKKKCAVCGDKLTPWENVVCIMCEPDELPDEYED